MMREMGIDERKYISDRIHRMGRDEHLQVYRILTAAGGRFTKNNNGYFFDITTTNEATVRKLADFVDYCDAMAAGEAAAAPLSAAPARSSAAAEGGAAPSQAPRAAAPAAPAAAAPSAGAAPPRYINERVRQFMNSISKNKAECTATRRRETSRFQNLRKKYSRPLAQGKGAPAAAGGGAPAAAEHALLFEESDSGGEGP